MGWHILANAGKGNTHSPTTRAEALVGTGDTKKTCPPAVVDGCVGGALLLQM